LNKDILAFLIGGVGLGFDSGLPIWGDTITQISKISSNYCFEDRDQWFKNQSNFPLFS
jgi:hypothetical protein